MFESAALRKAVRGGLLSCVHIKISTAEEVGAGRSSQNLSEAAVGPLCAHMAVGPPPGWISQRNIPRRPRSQERSPLKEFLWREARTIASRCRRRVNVKQGLADREHACSESSKLICRSALRGMYVPLDVSSVLWLRLNHHLIKLSAQSLHVLHVSGRTL